MSSAGGTEFLTLFNFDYLKFKCPYLIVASTSKSSLWSSPGKYKFIFTNVSHRTEFSASDVVDSQCLSTGPDLHCISS